MCIALRFARIVKTALLTDGDCYQFLQAGGGSNGSSGTSASPSAAGLSGVDALDRVLCPPGPTGGATSGERPSSEGASEDGADAAGPEQAGGEATLRFMVAGERGMSLLG